MSRPKIAAIVVTYNQEEFIETNLRSIFGQTGDFDLEICIFEDHSTDSTAEIIERATSEFEATAEVMFPNRKTTIKKIFHSKNLGSLGNSNYTWEWVTSECDADYVAIIDGDDYWCSLNRLETCMKYLSRRKHKKKPACANMVYLHYVDEGKCILHPAQVEIANSKDHFISDHVLSRTNPIATAGAAFYRMSALKQVPKELTDLAWGEWLLNFMLSWQGPFGFIDEPMTFYRIHSKGIFSGRTNVNGPDEEVLGVVEFVNDRFPGVYEEGLQQFLETFYPHVK